jgi:hypothetical protein
MAHGIEPPYDIIFSTMGTEWHDMAQVREIITKEDLKPLFFDIVEGEVKIQLDNESVVLPDKAIIADYRFRTDIEEGKRIKPLSIMGKDYRTILNKDIYDAIETAINEYGLDCKVTSAGTLQGGKKFFVSLMSESGKNVDPLNNGDTMNFFTNIASSHDGTLAETAWNSCTRIVCMNTLRASLSNADMMSKIYHTKNASLAMKSLPELLVAMRNKQEDVVNAISYLAGIETTIERSRRIVSGYMVEQTGGELELSTRATNTINDILTLSIRGKGNSGDNLYDLLNGVTEYYTSGNGTGRKANTEEKLYKANFGTASEHKERFFQSMLNGGWKDLEETGSKAVLKPV